MNDVFFAKGILNYKYMMFRVALGILKNESDAEEIVCESIAKAYERKDTLKKPEAFKSWITSIVIHTSYDYVKKMQRYIGEVSEDMLYADRQCGTKKTIEEEYLQKEENAKLWEYVNDLEEEFRIVVILYYYEEFSVKEIAKFLGLPVGTVKSRLSRARKKLYAFLTKKSSVHTYNLTATK